MTRDPLVPKIGPPKTRATGSTGTINPLDPWMPRERVTNRFRMAALNPAGFIAPVPTTTYRPRTTRAVATLPFQESKEVVSAQDVMMPLLDSSIYFDQSKDDRVANRMQQLCRHGRQAQQKRQTELRPLPLSVPARLNPTQWEDLLSLYENNQVFYQDRLEDKSWSQEKIIEELNRLEQWFRLVREPQGSMSHEEWKEKEQYRIQHGYSSYCSPDLRPLIGK